ncbi:hypothetical protein N7451_005646 [Penicillium sp. IBT 35674x]|nr:hypothetical protein N7451_005646 [Penicillium sp. IBT 35674x]
MPPLSGFSDNQFCDRKDVLLATQALVGALTPYFSSGKARVQLPIHSGAHFDEAAAQLEGFARPIWAIAAAVANPANEITPDIADYCDRLVTGLANGVNPEHPEYWGAVGDWDQRMVEAEPISFALLIAPRRFYETLSATSRRHLSDWLFGLNGKVMPVNNWRWFRVFSNLALCRVCGVPFEVIRDYIDADFAVLDQFEIGDGWSADGIWRADESPAQEAYSRQADYYSGSFAIQFSQLLYCIIAAETDPDRVVRYRQQAKDFARQFWRYFDKDGAAIPFGRSLTYRFATAAFYSAFALAQCCDSDRYTSVGFVKGMLFRHLRWWARHSRDIFATDGTLNIGYTYPNMFMCEDYNSPQSPYWAMKSFVVLALQDNEEFWAEAEISHPLAASNSHSRTAGVELVHPPLQILCNQPEGQHHFMLSGGQFCKWPLKATQAKYSKFAYSSAFGFSVPTGGVLTQIAPDSTLALSRDAGESWTTRWETTGNPRSMTLSFGGAEVQCLQSVWRPWKVGDIEIETTLIPPSDFYPDWHVRIHRIRNLKWESADSIKLNTVEGGFAVQAKRPRQMSQLTEDWKSTSKHGGVSENNDSSLVFSDAGICGVKNLLSEGASAAEGKILKSDPNTNLMEPKTLIPTVQHNIEIRPGLDATIASGVFAIAKGVKCLTREELRERWLRHPSLELEQLR